MTGLLWKHHPATSRQAGLFDKQRRKRSARPTQADVLIAMLREARAHGKPLELPAIMQAGIAQHGARFTEIRSQGFAIRNEIDKCNGAVRSCYWLEHDPERNGQR